MPAITDSGRSRDEKPWEWERGGVGEGEEVLFSGWSYSVTSWISFVYTDFDIVGV